MAVFTIKVEGPYIDLHAYDNHGYPDLDIPDDLITHL